jgi:osmotically-inducible protein OsmY
MRVVMTIGLSILPLIVVGCGGPNMRQVHEAPLLDNKVLQQRVEAALGRAGSDFKNVHVTVDGGDVTLGGNVPSADARARAEEISRGVYGVKKTDNEIELNKVATSP